MDNCSRAQPRHDFRRTQILARPVAAPLQLTLALGQSLRPNQDLPGDADQVGGGEFGAGALVGVVVQDLDDSPASRDFIDAFRASNTFQVDAAYLTA